MPNKKTAIPFLLSGAAVILLSALYILSFKYETLTLKSDAPFEVQQQVIDYAFPNNTSIHIQFEIASLTYSSAEKENLLLLQVVIPTSQIEDFTTQYNNMPLTEVSATSTNTFYEVKLPLTSNSLESLFIANATSNFAYRNILFLVALLLCLILVYFLSTKMRLFEERKS